jgi:hypothetical protein
VKNYTVYVQKWKKKLDEKIEIFGENCMTLKNFSLGEAAL